MFTIYHKILVLPKMSSSPIMQPIACADANWPSPQHPVRDRAQYTTMICRNSLAATISITLFLTWKSHVFY